MSKQTVVFFLNSVIIKVESSRDAVCESPVLWLVVAADVGTAQLLDQDPNDVDELDKVDLKEDINKEVF